MFLTQDGQMALVSWEVDVTLCAAPNMGHLVEPAPCAHVHVSLFTIEGGSSINSPRTTRVAFNVIGTETVGADDAHTIAAFQVVIRIVELPLFDAREYLPADLDHQPAIRLGHPIPVNRRFRPGLVPIKRRERFVPLMEDSGEPLSTIHRSPANNK